MLEGLPDWARKMLAGARVARLAFRDGDGLPRVLPITFAIREGVVWSAIDRKPKQTVEPARVRWLRQRPEAALTVDVYDDDWSKLAWVELLGDVKVLASEEAPEALRALAAKYAPYGEQLPPGPLLRFEVERALHWRASEH